MTKKKKKVCKCRFDGKHRIRALTLFLCSAHGQLHREAPSCPSRPLTSRLGASRRDQARPRPTCLWGWRLHQPTYIILVHTWALTREDRKCDAYAPPLRPSVLPSPPLLANCWWRVIPVSSGVKATPTFDLPDFTHLDPVVCSRRQLTQGVGHNEFPRHCCKLEKPVQLFLFN